MDLGSSEVGTTCANRVAVVTGGGASGDGIGNGRAAALLLAAAGASVVVVDRNESDGARTVEMISEQGGSAHLVVGDATSADDCERLATTTESVFGPATILVNNVGIGSSGSVVDTEPSDWERVMRINVDSMYHVSRHLIPQMARAGGGAIVNISSISAIRPRGLTAYTTSKGAVIALTQAMAVDHGPEGIRVNAVLPGPVYTPMVQRPGMTPKQREKRAQASLLGVEGTGWDIGHAVVFLASDQARYITGHSLVVDGGTSLRSPGR